MILQVLLIYLWGTRAAAGDQEVYSTAWAVKNLPTYDDKWQRESLQGGTVRGSYGYLRPDGVRQVVTYTGSNETGFIVQVDLEDVMPPFGDAGRPVADSDRSPRGALSPVKGNQLPLPLSLSSTASPITNNILRNSPSPLLLSTSLAPRVSSSRVPSSNSPSPRALSSKAPSSRSLSFRTLSSRTSSPKTPLSRAPSSKIPSLKASLPKASLITVHPADLITALSNTAPRRPRPGTPQLTSVPIPTKSSLFFRTPPPPPPTTSLAPLPSFRSSPSFRPLPAAGGRGVKDAINGQVKRRADVDVGQEKRDADVADWRDLERSHVFFTSLTHQYYYPLVVN